MAAPEGYTKLGNVGYADKGVYSADATYNKYNVVYHEGSTYVALKDNLHGVTPANGENWRYMAKGFNETSADGITVIDTSGIIDGTKNKKTILQTFLDKVGDFIINKAVTNEALLLKLADYVKKTDIVQTESTATDKVPSSAYIKSVKDTINSNLGMKITSGSVTEIIGALPVGKYAGYYSSGSFDAPSHYGTFEAVVMNPSTATITAIDTSNKVSYFNVKTSDVWCGWQSSSYGIYLSNRDLNTVTLPGTYIQTANASATTTLHYPVAGAAGFLEVVGLNNNDWLLQRYTGWGTANQTYKRVLYQGSWRDWMAE